MLAEENYRPPCFFANSVVEVLVEAPTRVFSHLHVKALFDVHVYQARPPDKASLSYFS